jgi:hypothetical protein
MVSALESENENLKQRARTPPTRASKILGDLFQASND